MPVLPDGLEDLRIETDVTRGLEAGELLLALDALLTILEHGFEADGREVDLGEGKTALVLLVDLPALADELGRVERHGAVDLDYLWLADDDTSTVLERHSPSSVLNGLVLKNRESVLLSIMSLRV